MVAFVRLVYHLANSIEIKFTCTITSAGASEYHIDESLVNWVTYNNRLKSLAILVKARNFFVFQQQQQTSHENMGSGTEKIALIFNMGAGYCDVVVTATTGGASQIKALAGSTIGGEDLLQNMMHHLLPNSENLFKNHGVKEIKQMGAVSSFAPKYKNLTEAQNVSLLLYHATPVYESLHMLKSSNEIMSTLATEGAANKYNFTVQSEGKDVNLKTKVNTKIVNNVYYSKIIL
ncbi:Heat shock protein 8 [Glycine soja]